MKVTALIVPIFWELSNRRGQGAGGGAQMVFVSAQKQDVRLAATADTAGRFQVDLPVGGWYVYLAGADGRTTYHSQLTVKPSESRNVTVVSR